MEKLESKVKRKNLILSLLLIVLTVFSYFLITYINNKEDSNKKLEKEYSIYNTTNLESIKKNTEMENNINLLNNIEEETNNEREDYYKNAQSFEQKVINGETESKIAYLTFDDGPYYSTYDYLKVLDEYNVGATFFTIGLGKEECYDNNSEDCTKLYREITSHGHTIANHTYSHLISRGLYSSTDSFITQVKKQEELIKEKTGVTTDIVRFPGGSSTARSLKHGIIEELKNNNYGWVDWTASDGDGGYLTNTIVGMTNLKKTINDKIEVILLHDYSMVTLALLPDLITYLEDNGYVLLPLFYESTMVNK